MSLKWRPRLKIYKDSTGNNTFDPETETAHSYSWWCYVRRIKGTLVFNDYNYSSTTNKHQIEMKYLLHDLGLSYVQVDVPNLKDFESQALEPIYRRIFQLEIEMRRKGSRKSVNESRAKSIEHLKSEIPVLRKLGAKFSLKQQKELRLSLEADEVRRIESRRDSDKGTKTRTQMIKSTSFELV